MTTPGPSDKLDPTIDPSLLELNGTTYRDNSYSAAAKRSAYHTALGIKRAELRASSSNATTHEQTFSTFGADGSPNGPINWVSDFTNNQIPSNYSPQGGTQGPSSEGWLMHSNGAGDSSRLRFNFVFNDGSAPHLLIKVTMRGAPNNGKNSYACLREARCVENFDPKSPICDEVDIAEFYGYPPNPRVEFTWYRSGDMPGSNPIGHGRYTQDSGNSDAGHAQYTYQVYLETGSYLSFTVWGPTGSSVYGHREYHVSDGYYIPTQPMYFYAGIWDCSSSDTDHKWCYDPPSGTDNGDTWMAISYIDYYTSLT